MSDKPKAVHHDSTSAIVEGTTGAAMGAAKWGLGAAIGGPLLLGLAIGTPVFLAGLATTGAISGFLAILGVVLGVGATVTTGFLGFTTFAPITAGLAAIGGLLGLGKAGSRINRETAEFHKQAGGQREKDYHTGYTAAQFDTYPVAFNDGRGSMAHDMEAMARQQMERAAHHGHPAMHGPTTAAAGAVAGGAGATALAMANCNCPLPKEAVGTKKHTGPLHDKRKQEIEAAAAAAAAGITIGREHGG